MSLAQESRSEEHVIANAHPGEILKLVREQKGLVTKDVANHLNLPVRFIEYLERGDFDLLPGDTFVRGYIRNYARFLGISHVDELVASLDDYNKVEAATEHSSAFRSIKKIKQRTQASNHIYWFFSFIIALIVIGFVFVWWQERNNAAPTEPKSETSEAVIIEPLTGQNTVQLAVAKEAESNTPIQTTTAADSSAVQNQEQQNVPSSRSEAQNTPPIVQENTTPTTGSQTATNNTPVMSATQTGQSTNQAGMGSVLIEVKNNCWVTLTDTDGKVLFNNVVAKDKSLAIQGKPPLNLVLGASSAVKRLAYNGETIPVQVSKNAFRIKLGR